MARTKHYEPVPEWQKHAIAVPLTQAFPQLGEVKEFKNKTCIFNSDRTRLFDVVSPRYQIVQHKDALDLVSGSLKEYFGSSPEMNVRTMNGGARIRAEFKLPMPPIKLGRSDISEITMVVQNSYDRSKPFIAQLGAFRLVCSNGMMIGQGFGSIRARHVITTLDQDDGPLGILPDLELMISRAPKIKDLWLQWRETKVEHEWAVQNLSGRFPDRYLTPVLEEDRYPQSRWDLYNELTRFSTHDTKSMQRRIDFDERIASLFYSEIEDAEEV